MSEDGRELVEQLHREAVEQHRAQRDKGRELVEAMFREALERDRERKEQERALVERVHREAIEQGRPDPRPPYEPQTVHYTELPDGPSDSPLYQEWNFYRREAGRLLAEGQEGRWLLIKGENIVGIWDTHDEAKAVALERYLMQPCLIHQIRSREPVLRGSSRMWRCQS